MKKILALLLAIVLVVSLAACNTETTPTPDPTGEPTQEPTAEPTTEPEPTTESEPTQTPEPTTAPEPEVGDFYNSLLDYSNEVNDGPIWQYMYTEDNFESLEYLMEYNASAWRIDTTPEDPEEQRWSGVGKSVGALELNSFGGDIGVLIFIAPATGKYTLRSFKAEERWSEEGDVAESFVIRVGEEQLHLAEFPENTSNDKADIPEFELNLEKGDKVYFYGTGSASLYANPVFDLIEISE